MADKVAVLHILGITDLAIDRKRLLGAFVFKIDKRTPIALAAELPIIEQVASALGKLRHMLRAAAPRARSEIVNADNVAQYLVRKDAFSERVLLQLVTTDGIPHMFALPPAGAVEIGDRLRTESAKQNPVGNA